MISSDKKTSEIFKKYDVIVEENSIFDCNNIIGRKSKIFKGGGLDSSIIGSYSYTKSYLVGSILGNYCSIENHVDTMLVRHPIDRITTSPCTLTESDEEEIFKNFKNKKNYNGLKEIIIKHDVWISDHVKIMPGITIETGAIVRAGAIVTHDVPAYAIVEGVPAKIIDYRFDTETCARLLKSEWFLYDWDNIDIPFGDDALLALSCMEDYMSKQLPPLLNQGIFIRVDKNNTYSIGQIKMRKVFIE